MAHLCFQRLVFVVSLVVLVATGGASEEGRLQTKEELEGNVACSPCEKSPEPIVEAETCPDMGAVWGLGLNYRGQLGDGTTRKRLSAPVRVVGLSDVTAIAAHGHSLAIRADGTVWGWGANRSGKLGDGTTEDRHAPVQVHGLSDVVAVAAGVDHSLALESDGTVWAWGGNKLGQLGDGTPGYRWKSDEAAEDHHTPMEVPGLTGVSAIAAASWGSLAMKRDGTVWAWGFLHFNDQGLGNAMHRYAPVQVSGLADVIAIAAGSSHYLALKADGTVWAWGGGHHGCMGFRSRHQPTPAQVAGLTHVVAVSAGQHHSLALKDDGTVWAWGWNCYGQLGDGTTVDRYVPTQVTGLTEVKAIVAAWQGSLALGADGTVWAWGGTCGGEKHTPVKVNGLGRAIAIAKGSHVLVIKDDVVREEERVPATFEEF